ncbi:MAG: hypothetical protein ACYTX0_37620 [Nostoc sp.]
MTAPDFFDRFTAVIQSAIVHTQENIDLKAENSQLKTANTDLQTKLDAITASLNEDEQEKADTATKLASLEKAVGNYEALLTPVAA